MLIRSSFPAIKSRAPTDHAYRRVRTTPVKQRPKSHEIPQQFYRLMLFPDRGRLRPGKLIVENLIIVELKCCKVLLPEHQAQLINYLKASALPVGLLVNFGNQKLDYKRLHHPDKFIATEGFAEESTSFFLSHQKNEKLNSLS